MKLKSLELKYFRNIHDQQLIFHEGLNIFRGPNGQGKTNLVEAIYLLTHGKSFRTSDNSALINHGDYQSTRVAAYVSRKNLSHDLDFRIQHGRKAVQHNGKKVGSTYLRQNFPSVLFSPESLAVVKDSPQHRRQLVDDLAMTMVPGFARLFDDTRKLLKQKNALLKQLKEGILEKEKGHRLFHNITDLLFAKSTRLIAGRLEILHKIMPIFREEFLTIMGDSLLEIEMDYLISGTTALQFNEDQIVNALYNRWSELAPSEVQLGQSLVGPHKHDVRFLFNGQDARVFCSQGQQRAIILAFKMAHIRLHCAAHGVSPLLLLDDVLSELDSSKQQRFLDYLMAGKSQIFLTTTDAAVIPRKVNKAVFEVNVGKFAPVEVERTGGLSV